MTGEQFFLNSLFNGLDFNKVSYCVLRNYEKLPNTTGNSDLDILINKSISEFKNKEVKIKDFIDNNFYNYGTTVKNFNDLIGNDL